MSEIERAKVQAAYDECYKLYSFYSEHRDTILSVLRAELEREKNPLTWNERINQMSAEEKGEFFATFDCRMTFDEDYDCGKHKGCKPCMIDFFNSPYTEGDTDEG